MNEDLKKIIFVIVLCLVAALILIIRKCLHSKKQHLHDLAEARTFQAQQPSGVWNISGQVSQDGAVTDPPRWPTHDHRISVDSFVVADNLRIPPKDRVPPPPYCEVDLPSYEQAIGTTLPKNDVPTVHVTASASRNLDISTHS